MLKKFFRPEDELLVPSATMTLTEQRQSSITSTLRYLHEQLSLAQRQGWLMQAASCQIIIDAIGENLDPSFTIALQQNGIPLCIVHENFLQKNEGFVEKFVQARQSAEQRYQEVLNLYTPHWPQEFQHLASVEYPVVFIDLDDLEETARVMQVDSTQLQSKLDGTPYAKADTQTILSSSDPGHDFPSYIKQSAQTIGISPERFLVQNYTHELLHNLIDTLTSKYFNTAHTWLNEGFCEVGANFTERAALPTRVPALQLNTPSDVNTILYTEDYVHKYSGGYLLVQAIAEIYNEQSSTSAFTEGQDQGLLLFCKELFTAEFSQKHPDLNQAVLALLEQHGVKDQVFIRVFELYQQILASQVQPEN